MTFPRDAILLSAVPPQWPTVGFGTPAPSMWITFSLFLMFDFLVVQNTYLTYVVYLSRNHAVDKATIFKVLPANVWQHSSRASRVAVDIGLRLDGLSSGEEFSYRTLKFCPLWVLVDRIRKDRRREASWVSFHLFLNIRQFAGNGVVQ